MMPDLLTRICTFNIRYSSANAGANSWDHRKELTLRVIRALDSDILALQECLPLQ